MGEGTLNNSWRSYFERAIVTLKLFDKYRVEGRSTAGEFHKNDTQIDISKKNLDELVKKK